jgi:LacI family transcriptional regulator
VGYAPNAAARSLRSGKTHRVALVYRRPLDDPHHASSYGAVTEALAGYLHDLDHHLLVQPHDTQEQVLAHLDDLARARSADLIVLWGREGDVEAQAAHGERLGIPFIVKGRHEQAHPAWPQVEFDHEAMMMTVVVRFTAEGHQRIAYVGHAADEPFRYRLFDGFQAAMIATTGAPAPDDLVFHGSDFSREAEGVVAGWFALPKTRRPTALAVGADSAAWEHLELALARRGLLLGDQPGQIAIAGNTGGPLHLLFGRGHVFDVDFFPLARVGCERLIGPLLRGEAAVRTGRPLPARPAPDPDARPARLRYRPPDERKSPMRRLTVALAAAALLAAPAARAQTVTGKDMAGYAAAFGLEPARQAKSWEVREVAVRVGDSEGANVLWPKQTATFTFRFTNKTDRPLTAEGRLETIPYGTRIKPGGIWTPTVFPIGKSPGSAPLIISLPPKGTAEVTVTPPIPERFGGYALVADLGTAGRAFAATLVRVPPPEPGRVQYPTYALDLPWPNEMSEAVATLFDRLGVRGCRMARATTPPPRPTSRSATGTSRSTSAGHRSTTSRHADRRRGRRPDAARPSPALARRQGRDARHEVRLRLAARSRPGLREVVAVHGVPLRLAEGTGQRHRAVERAVEGISISGWGADMLRYRELYERMAKGIVAARASDGIQVLIGGALLLHQHAGQALLRRHRQVSALPGLRQHPLPAACRRPGTGEDMGEPAVALWPGPRLGYGELDSELGRPRGGRHRLDAGAGTEPDRGYLPGQRLHARDPER